MTKILIIMDILVILKHDNNIVKRNMVEDNAMEIYTWLKNYDQ